MHARCAECGYDWAGLKLTGGVLRCPECGVEGPPAEEFGSLLIRAPSILRWTSLPTFVMCLACFALVLCRVSESIVLGTALVTFWSGIVVPPIAGAVLGWQTPRSCARVLAAMMVGWLANLVVGALFFVIGIAAGTILYPMP